MERALPADRAEELRADVAAEELQADFAEKRLADRELALAEGELAADEGCNLVPATAEDADAALESAAAERADRDMVLVDVSEAGLRADREGALGAAERTQENKDGHRKSKKQQKLFLRKHASQEPSEDSLQGEEPSAPPVAGSGGWGQRDTCALACSTTVSSHDVM